MGKWHAPDVRRHACLLLPVLNSIWSSASLDIQQKERSAPRASVSQTVLKLSEPCEGMACPGPPQTFSRPLPRTEKFLLCHVEQFNSVPNERNHT